MSGLCEIERAAERDRSTLDAGFPQRGLQARHADPCGSLRRSRTAPVGLQAHRVPVAIALERAQLSYPIDCARTNRGPIVLAPRFADDIFRVAMSDPVLRQQVISVGIGRRSREGGGISRIPIQHEVPVGNCLEHRGGFLSRGRVARHLILEHQDDLAPGADPGSFAQLIIDFFILGQSNSKQ